MGEFQRRLKAAMALRNLKAVELSQRSGVGKSDISNYLKGAYNAKQDKVFLLARALDVDPGWLSATDQAEFNEESEIPSAGFPAYEQELDLLTCEIVRLVRNLPDNKKRALIDLLRAM